MFAIQSKPKCVGQVLLIPVERIIPNPSQPRRIFSPADLKDLSESIQENGVLQPLSVRSIPGGKYELIAGERRLRASKLIGLSKVPCIQVDASTEESAVYALLENIQRKDLSYFEEAEAIYMLGDQFGLSQEECARKLGKAQSTLSNKLRLLKLSPEVRKIIAENNLSERHARALLKLDDEESQKSALDTIIKKKLNVADTDKLIERLLNPPKPHIIPKRIFKDIRIFMNTVNHAVETMKKAGVDAVTGKTETDEYIEYTIKIPK